MEAVVAEQVGFSPERLSRIVPAMQAYVDRGKLPGVLTLVARHGQIAHLETVGMMDVEAGKPMREDTIFRIYSMSKPITSVAVMMLYEEGRYHLNDPVSRFIPEFEHVQVYRGKTETGIELADPEREITIRDLLTHTSGLSYGFEEGSYVDQLYQKRLWGAVTGEVDWSLADAVREIAHLPLAHQPGSAWRYSVATDVLGYLVQVVSEQPFEEFLQQHIFDPSGMVDTSFCVPQAKVERFAANYIPAEEGGLELFDAPQTSRYTRPTRFPSGGGGLLSTAADYARFSQMLLNKGELDGVRLLGRKTVELMAMNHLPRGMHPNGDPAVGFGLGFSVMQDVAQSQILGSVGTFRWGGAASTAFWIDPREELFAVLMTQLMRNDRYPVARDFQVLVYQALVD